MRRVVFEHESSPSHEGPAAARSSAPRSAGASGQRRAGPGRGRAGRARAEEGGARGGRPWRRQRAEDGGGERGPGAAGGSGRGGGRSARGRVWSRLAVVGSGWFFFYCYFSSLSSGAPFRAAGPRGASGRDGPRGGGASPAAGSLLRLLNSAEPRLPAPGGGETEPLPAGGSSRPARVVRGGPARGAAGRGLGPAPCGARSATRGGGSAARRLREAAEDPAPGRRHEAGCAPLRPALSARRFAAGISAG